MRACAFSPGHVTGFFVIKDRGSDVRKKGSLGAGICLSKGAFTTVSIRKSSQQKIDVFLNNKKSAADVSRFVAKKILGEKKYHVVIKSILQLPVSQGFGMSGAGALSTGIAMNNALKSNLPFSKIVEIAHESEIFNKTGLGDVVAESVGGAEIRVKEGLPPYGMLRKIKGNHDVVLCVLGKGMKTKTVLSNPEQRRKINRYGSVCVKKMIEKPTIENLFNLSHDFALKTGLANKRIIKAIEEAKKYGMGSQAMLGNSVFAVGDTKKLVKTLKNFGKVYVCRTGGKVTVL
ncbi:MAG: pantoate kinase [Thermoplasmatales archaeon]|nr:pantoate kinase [Thermoplasmatales archaeon]